MATGWSAVGPSRPLVTSPMVEPLQRSAVRRVHAPAHAPAPSGRRASWPAARVPSSWASTRSAPGKPPARAPPVRRTFCMAQFSAASTGVVVVSMSLPYRHSPASRRSELRAPRPTGLTSGCASRARAKASALVGGQGNLETVFAGVAAAGDEQVGTGPVERGAGHEHQFLHAGQQALQRGHGLRTLQREQGAVELGIDMAAAGRCVA